MKNITVTADERVIEEARERAREEEKTLNEAFRLWLEDYTCRKELARRAMEVIEDIRRYAKHDGRRFTRDEMNER